MDAPVLETRPEGLYCACGDFFIDPWRPVARAVLTHAHGDHARPGHGAALCSEGTAPLLRRRLEGTRLETLRYGEKRRIGGAAVSLHPAGHMLGSAQVRVETKAGVWVVSGDYKRQEDPTCAPFEPVRCQVFVTEATFALPIYRWPDAGAVSREIAAWWRRNKELGRASALFCYAFGKAQRLLALLGGLTGEEVLVHGMAASVNEAYAAAGQVLPRWRALREDERGKELAGRLVLAPPSAKGTPWLRRFPDAETAFASGWMRVRGQRRRRSYDRGFALSDHADWPALLATIRETGASRVLATHGGAQTLARYLRERGLDAQALPTPYGAEEED